MRLRHCKSLISLAFFVLFSFWNQSGYAQKRASVQEFEQTLSLAELNNVPAEITVGRDYYSGVNGHLDYKKAMEWFEKAANQGSEEAKSWIASMYLFGFGVTKDIDRARDMLLLTTAANDPLGFSFLGIMHESGVGFPKDPSAAAEIYQHGVNLGGGRAAELLGTLYYIGRGVPKDRVKATQLYLLSTRLGNDWGQVRLADLYANGEGVLANPQLALKLYEASAKQGNKLAEYKLASLYEKGQQVEQNPKMARVFYHRSAMKNYAPALSSLAMMTWTGDGTGHQNPVAAYVWMSFAAAQNHPTAARQLEQWEQTMNPADLAQAKDYVAHPDSFMHSRVF